MQDYYGNANGYGTILDSGTTLLIVTTKMMEIYTQRLQAMCNQGIHLVGICNQTFANSILNGTCWNMTQEQVNAYPSMYFTLWNNDNHNAPFTLTIKPQVSKRGFFFYFFKNEKKK